MRFSAARSSIAAVAILGMTVFVSASAALPPARDRSFNFDTITLPNGAQHTLQVPAGLHLSLYATGLPTARFMTLGPHGDVFVGSWIAGTVSVLLNRAGGPRATRVATLLQGLTVPHSVAYRGGQLYVAEEGAVSAFRYDSAGVRLSGQRVVIAGLPVGGRHVTRTVAIDAAGRIYVSIGSSCNECVDLVTRAVIMRYRPDGTGGQVYARGLRNAVGLAWQPGTGLLWATDNGRDLLGEDIPPDEIDIVHGSGNYGWPYCWGAGQPDPAVASAAGYCGHTIAPTLALPAHVAPLGLTFYTGSLLPRAYRGGIFVAYHGSTYRTQPVGYKVVFIPVHGTQAGPPVDVITGWLPSGAGSGSQAWGRPVGMLVAADGSLLISDDLAGVVYRLAPVGR